MDAASQLCDFIVGMKEKEIFAYRTRMKNLACNFKQTNADLSCKTGVSDSQEHLLLCNAIMARSPIIKYNKTVNMKIYSAQFL